MTAIVQSGGAETRSEGVICEDHDFDSVWLEIFPVEVQLLVIGSKQSKICDIICICICEHLSCTQPTVAIFML